MRRSLPFRSALLRPALTATSLAALLSACGGELALAPAGPEGLAVVPGSPEEAAILALVNDPAVDLVTLDDAAGLDARAARGIIDRRDGPDALPGTADDRPFASVTDLDAVPYVGASALERLLAYAIAHSYQPGDPGEDPPGPDAVEAAVLLFVNDEGTTLELLDVDVGLDARAARGIVERRDGPDQTFGTSDDAPFASLAELDAVAWVGESALADLEAWAIAHGWLDRAAGRSVDVVFSPQAYADSHLARVRDLIRGAERSLDIALYSFSDYGLYDELDDAVARGVSVRLVFETASEDRKATGTALDATRSARLERAGVDVRWVNKIMHHKFAIADGPRHHREDADTARVATGSGNWSYGAATQYDENTLFLNGEAALNLLLQREFDRLWNHAKDFEGAFAGPAVTSSLVITDEVVAAAGSPADAWAHFTSGNFDVSEGSTTFRVNGGNAVADALVEAIAGATQSIWIASGHLRSRPVAEALEARLVDDPALDVRIYLDGQEFLAESTHEGQVADRNACLAAATTESQTRKCYDRGFLYSYELSEQYGANLRYKHYAYRWHYSYAAQMHHKVLIIDGDELWTGSYNLSDNAEHNTFENMIVLRGARFQDVIDRYEANFLSLWDTGREEGLLGQLTATIEQAQTTLPIVYEPMALTWSEVAALKGLIRDTCPAVNSEAYRTEPERHLVCEL